MIEDFKRNINFDFLFPVIFNLTHIILKRVNKSILSSFQLNKVFHCVSQFIILHIITLVVYPDNGIDNNTDDKIEKVSIKV